MSEMSSGEEALALADVDLVQQCIEGNEEAISQLKRSLTPFLSKVLGSYGASKDEIDEILAQLWGDCLVGPRPLFHVFNGRSALKSWLTAICVNRWISLKRREAQHTRAIYSLTIDAERSAPAKGATSHPDSSIIEILGPALRRGLRSLRRRGAGVAPACAYARGDAAGDRQPLEVAREQGQPPHQARRGKDC